MLSSTYLLTELRYREAKRCISAKFTSEYDRRKYNYEFHPSLTFRVHNTENAKKLGSLLSDFSLCVIQDGTSLKIFFENFKELREAYSFLCNATLLRPVLLESERQFLLQKGWSYFDGFFIDAEPKKLNEATFSNSGYSGRAAALANILSITPEYASKVTDYEAAILFLENILYKSCEPLQARAAFFPAKYFQIPDAKELALSIVKNNIGFETVKRIDYAQAKKSMNILGSSLVNVKFMQNAFFFNSALPCFANIFHKTHANKHSREARMREFSLNGFPVGPFFAGQKETIPLIDALELEQKRFVSILGPEVICYISNERRSSLSAAIASILEKVEHASVLLRELEKTEVAHKGLAAFSDENTERVHINEFMNAANKLLHSVLYRLLDENSAFFRYDVAAAIYACTKETQPLTIPNPVSLRFSCKLLRI